MKTIKLVLLGALVALFGSSAQAVDVTFKGQTITYTGTEASHVQDGNNSVTITWKSGTGTLSVSSDATATVLAVGGGGGGGGCLRTGSTGSRVYTGGNGGDAGGVDEQSITVSAEDALNITVGNGGQGGQYQTSGSSYNGSNGNASTIVGATSGTTYANGTAGNGGSGNQSDANAVDGQGANGQTGTNKKNGKQSSVSGSPVTYGTGGTKKNNSGTTRTALTNNTGNGGNGAGNAQNNVGQGGDRGIVIVKITDIKKPVETWECKDVIHLSLKDHPTEVVTNQFGAFIPYGADMSDIVDDPDVAKVISTNVNGTAYVAITNPSRDGDAVVSFTTGGTNYTYTVMAATVEIVKTVKAASEDEPGNKSNATIRIVTHILNNPKPATPKVLFIGTACSSHVDGKAARPMVEAISATVNGLTKKADVSARVVINTGSTSAPSFTVNANEFKMGSPEVTYTAADSSSDWTKGTVLRVQGASHACMVTIYNLLKEIADNEKGTYDYIVMEFDGSRLGASQMANNGNNFEYQAETENATTLLRDVTVAKFLKEYYDLGRIIWIVDDSSTAGKIQNDSTQYFPEGSFFPLQSSNFDASHKPEFIRIKSFRGMMGLLNPDVYLTWVNNDTGAWVDANWTSWVDNTANRLVIEKAKLDCPDGKMQTAGETYPGYLLKGHAIQKAADAPSTESEHWTTYNDATKITSLLEELVKPVPHDIELEDKVITLDQTLDTRSLKVDTTGELGGVRFYELDPSKTNGVAKADFIDADKEIWKDPTTKGVGYDAEASMITGGVSKITTEYWCKIEIDIITSPTFLKDALAYKDEWELAHPGEIWPNVVKDEETGKYSVNPNDGDAEVTLYRGNGNQRVKCSAFAKGTTVFWEMEDDNKLVLEAQCVTNIYDGAYHTLTNFLVYKEGDEAKTPILDALISNSLDQAEWSLTNAVPNFGFVNVTNDAPVYVQAFKSGYEPSEITNATVTILKRPIWIESRTQKKAYNGTPLTLIPATDIEVDKNENQGKYDYVAGETFTYGNFASITDVGGPIEATFDCYDGTAKLSNYDLHKVFGTLTITPPEDAINVYSGSETFAYDGEAHTNAVTWYEDKKKVLADGDTVVMELKFASVTTPDEGEVTNDFARIAITNAVGQDVTANYLITTNAGILKVTNAVFSVTAKGVNKVYDGVSAKATVTVDPPKGVSAGEPVIKYRKGATGDFGPTNPDFLNVSDSADVWYTVSATYYDTYTGHVSNVISPRPVTIKSQGDQKNYDTFPLEIPGFDITSEYDFISGETYETYDEATQTEVGETNATFKVRLTGNAKDENYTITKDEEAVLKVIPAGSIGVTSLDKEWPFDGSAHRFDGTDAYTVTGLLPGDGVKVEFSEDSKITYPSENPVVNTMSSIIITNSAGEDVTSQYGGISTNNFGKLTIKPLPFAGVVAQGVDKVYDGESYTITLTVPDQTPAPKAVPAIGYSEKEEGPFNLSEPPTYSNVCEQAVYFKVEADGYITTNGFATVKITPRPLLLKSGDAEDTYNGEPVSNGTVKVEKDATHTYDLVAGHSLGKSLAYSYQLNQGSGDNFFNWEIVDGNGQDVKANYKVDEAKGTLTVNPLEVSFGFAAKDKEYDGTTDAETTQTSYTNETGVTGESIVFDVTSMKFDFNTPKVGDNTVTGAVYSADCVTVVKGEGAKNPTDDQGVLKGNYTLTYIPSAPAKIWKRALTNENAIVANDQVMTYGDTPPALAGQYTGGENVAEGEDLYVDLAYTNETWNVGEYPDAITTNKLMQAIVISNGTEDVTANYVIEFKAGKLTVNPKDGRDPSVEVAAVTDTFYYNDYAYQPKPAVTDTAFDPDKTLKEGVDFDYAWLDNVNATNEARVIVNFKGNYKNSATNTFKILKRTVMLTSKGGTWTYDGAAHGTNEVSATAYNAIEGQEDKDGGQGFVPGEGVTTNVTGTITDVGTKKNTFSYYLLEPQTLERNYDVDTTEGDLTVNPAKIDPKTPPEDRRPPEDPTPEDPGDDDPPDDAKVPTLWAPDVCKYYDGIPTNTQAKVYGVDPAYAFTYEYTTNENRSVDANWYKELPLTDVLRDSETGAVKSYAVYCRAKDEAGNYVGTNYLAYVTILPRPLDDEHGEEFSSVVANDTNMVYGTSAPLESDLTFTPPKGLLESDDMYVALAYTNEYESLSTLDLGDYEGMVSTNKAAPAIVITNRTTGVDVTANYAITFRPGTLTVEAAGLAVTAESVTNCYDATTNRLENYTITDKQFGNDVTPKAISNSVDGVTWYLKDDFPLYVDVTNEAPVWVAVVADNYATFVSEGPLATVTVTQKVLTVTLNDTNKVYGAETPKWTVKNVEGLVGKDKLTGKPGSIIGKEPTDARDTPYEVPVGVGSLSAGGNYTIVVKDPTLTINPLPVTPENDVVRPGGNTPEEIEEYMKGVPGGTLVAFRTEVWTNDVPEVTTSGTNIVVRFKGLTDADTAAATFEWSTTGETGPWSSTEPNFTEICAEQVWCKVTCPNYVATNAFSYVYIKSRESKPDDEEAEEEDKLQPNPDPTKPTTEEQTEKVVEDIAANDNRNPGYDPTKPVWDGEGTMSGGSHGVQTDAKVNLKVTSIGNLEPEDQKKAEDHLAEEIENAQKRSDVDPDSVKGRSVDVKLLYTRTYSDGTQIEGIDIGGSNTELIPFTIAVALAEDEEILKVTRYHAGVEAPLVSPEHFELSADRKYVTVYAKTYSEFIIVQGTRVKPKEAQAYVYYATLDLRTTQGEFCSKKQRIECGESGTDNLVRKWDDYTICGYIYGCENGCAHLMNICAAVPVSYSRAAGSASKGEIFWDSAHKVAIIPSDSTGKWNSGTVPVWRYTLLNVVAPDFNRTESVFKFTGAAKFYTDATKTAYSLSTFDLVCAGNGIYSTDEQSNNKAIWVRAAGAAAGSVDKVYRLERAEDGTAYAVSGPALGYNCTEGCGDPGRRGASVAYGSWTLTYCQALSKAYGLTYATAIAPFVEPYAEFE